MSLWRWIADVWCTTVPQCIHLSEAFAELFRATLGLDSALFELFLELSHL